MREPKLQLIEITSELNNRLSEVDAEFGDILSLLGVERDLNDGMLTTFSPLDALCDFEKQGLQAVPEVSKDEMFENNDAMKKLLANMLAQCSPGSLSDEDLVQISGINGREVNSRL